MASRPQPAHRRTHSNTSNGAPSIHRRPSGGSDHSRTRSMGRESSRGGGAARQDASTSRPLHTEGDPLPYEWSSTYLLSMRDTLMKSMNTMARHGGFHLEIALQSRIVYLLGAARLPTTPESAIAFAPGPHLAQLANVPITNLLQVFEVWNDWCNRKAVCTFPILGSVVAGFLKKSVVPDQRPMVVFALEMYRLATIGLFTSLSREQIHAAMQDFTPTWTEAEFGVYFAIIEQAEWPLPKWRAIAELAPPTLPTQPLPSPNPNTHSPASSSHGLLSPALSSHSPTLPPSAHASPTLHTSFNSWPAQPVAQSIQPRRTSQSGLPPQPGPPPQPPTQYAAQGIRWAPPKPPAAQPRPPVPRSAPQKPIPRPQPQPHQPRVPPAAFPHPTPTHQQQHQQQKQQQQQQFRPSSSGSIARSSTKKGRQSLIEKVPIEPLSPEEQAEEDAFYAAAKQLWFTIGHQFVARGLTFADVNGKQLVVPDFHSPTLIPRPEPTDRTRAPNGTAAPKGPATAMSKKQKRQQQQQQQQATASAQRLSYPLTPAMVQPASPPTSLARPATLTTPFADFVPSLAPSAFTPSIPAPAHSFPLSALSTSVVTAVPNVFPDPLSVCALNTRSFLPYPSALTPNLPPAFHMTVFNMVQDRLSRGEGEAVVEKMMAEAKALTPWVPEARSPAEQEMAKAEERKVAEEARRIQEEMDGIEVVEPVVATSTPTPTTGAVAEASSGEKETTENETREKEPEPTAVAPRSTMPDGEPPAALSVAAPVQPLADALPSSDEPAPSTKLLPVESAAPSPIPTSSGPLTEQNGVAQVREVPLPAAKAPEPEMAPRQDVVEDRSRRSSSPPIPLATLARARRFSSPPIPLASLVSASRPPKNGTTAPSLSRLNSSASQGSTPSNAKAAFGPPTPVSPIPPAANVVQRPQPALAVVPKATPALPIISYGLSSPVAAPGGSIVAKIASRLATALTSTMVDSSKISDNQSEIDELASVMDTEELEIDLNVPLPALPPRKRVEGLNRPISARNQRINTPYRPFG